MGWRGHRRHLLGRISAVVLRWLWQKGTKSLRWRRSERPDRMTWTAPRCVECGGLTKPHLRRPLPAPPEPGLARREAHCARLKIDHLRRLLKPANNASAGKEGATRGNQGFPREAEAAARSAQPR